MTYTAQSCREEAAINDKFGDPIMNDPDLLRAHADALEKNARLKADTSILHQSIGLLTTIDPAMEVDPVNPLGMAEHLTQYVDAIKDRMMGAEAELAKLRQHAEAESSVDHFQRTGRDRDIINEAIAAYDRFMLLDDYDAQSALSDIIGTMRRRLGKAK